jgi:hypothetical protein
MSAKAQPLRDLAHSSNKRCLTSTAKIAKYAKRILEQLSPDPSSTVGLNKLLYAFSTC